ncbi:MAG: 16S rRNA (guanine(527)-N(7))-methyltransferase RsmG [Acholeplasmatales bacterium]|nr:16S rRNA (guanine(527)-N(7))-methyltransferase RsmG [Acholeplasmatales bacterium]
MDFKEEFICFVKEEFHIVINEEQLKKFDIYYNFLSLSMKYINLSAIKLEREIYFRHFADSLSVYNLINETQKIVDVGFGAGFPSIPLKIINPKLNISLVEIDKTKCIFIKQLLHMLKIYDVVVINDDVKNIKFKYDIFLSRAFAGLDILFTISKKILKKDGKIVFQTIKNDLPITKWKYVLEKTIKYQLPVVENERFSHLIRML